MAATGWRPDGAYVPGEAALGMRLDHPTVCHIVRPGETEDGLVSVVMPFVQGEILSDRTHRAGSRDARTALRMMKRAALLLLLLPLPLAAQDATRAQRSLARADSLVSAGQLARAEAVYYSVSRQQTRDPEARAALGSYLASRGAFLIGATLLDEALAFGGDTARLAARRAPILQVAGDWAQVAALRRSPLSGAERARAAWLSADPPAMRGEDSVTVAFFPSSAGALGRFWLVIGTDSLATDVDASSDELVIGDYRAFAHRVELFAVSGDGGASAAVVRSADLGGIVLTNVPARVDARLGPQRARIGLTMLAALAPTIDAAAGVITVRRAGLTRAAVGRTRIPLVFTFPGVQIARPDRLVPFDSPAGRAVLATARWTLDARRGELVLETDARSRALSARGPEAPRAGSGPAPR